MEVFRRRGASGWGGCPAGGKLDYAGAVVRLLRDDALRARLTTGCRLAADRCHIGVRFDFRGEYITATQLTCTANVVVTVGADLATL